MQALSYTDLVQVLTPNFHLDSHRKRVKERRSYENSSGILD